MPIRKHAFFQIMPTLDTGNFYLLLLPFDVFS